MSGPSGKLNPWLDVVRSTAIMLVLLSHGRVFVTSQYPVMQVFKFGGFLGVELFFVLSGFLIGRILYRLSDALDFHNVKVFLTRRWLRTLPNYYLFIAVNVGLAWCSIRPTPLDGFARYIFFTQNLTSGTPPFFGESWSLSVEELFYLGFPIIAALIAKLCRTSSKRAMILLGAMLIPLCLIARLIVAKYSHGTWTADFRTAACLRFDALMIGVLAAFYVARHGVTAIPATLKYGLVTFFVAAAYFTAIWPDSALDKSYFAKTILFNIASFGCLGVLLIGLTWPIPRMARFVGNSVARLAFSCYLVNLPILYLFRTGLGITDGFPAYIGFIVATFAVSALVYRFWELPFLRYRDTGNFGPGRPDKQPVA